VSVNQQLESYSGRFIPSETSKKYSLEMRLCGR